MNCRIPKIIHYCWFGGKPLPKSAIKCINSWKKFLPDYEIKEWNESNFDVNMIPYTREAYAAQKYAFVSDYARFWILYHHGGLYFDTDVEIIQSMQPIIEKGPFMGCENKYKAGETAKNMNIAPGLGLGATVGLDVYKKLLDLYSTQPFVMNDGSLNLKTVVEYTTHILCLFGLTNSPDIQKVSDIWIYPQEYFNPLNNNTGVLEITHNTYSIHWFSMSWLPKSTILKSKITRLFHRYFGDDCFSFFKS